MRKIIVFSLAGIALLILVVMLRNGVLREQQQLSAADAEQIAKQFPGAQKTPSGLMYIVRTPGTGATPPVGSMVTAHYEGRLLNGSKFDSSYDRGQPLTFQVGVGRVVAGWDEALVGMQKGEKRTLIIPYWLGYGRSARGPIPARATMVFEVELVDFQVAK